MRNPLARFSEPAYALLRIVAGLLFAFHGAQKVFGLFGMDPAHLDAQMKLGGWIELAGGLLIAVGFWATLAAFLASGEMAVAYFQFHFRHDPATHAPSDDAKFLLPGVNMGDLAVVFCFLFLYIACRGAGRWSVDACCTRSAQPTA